ncbi:hypothetical protein D5086_021920 [Populus alba]|uniref:Uncharacterized protein n=1 Tax=Populus alba TaxID=43335 RepID=A0ACC4BEZ8_POPAL
MDGALEATKEADQKIRDAVVGGKNKSHYNDDDDDNVVEDPVVFEKVPKFCRVAWLKGKTMDWESDTLFTLAINRQNKFQSEKDWYKSHVKTGVGSCHY